MAIPVFPASLNQYLVYPLSSHIENPAISSPMENGTVVSRPRFTRARETFVLRWTALPVEQYALLRSFWRNDVKGGSMEFNWTYPAVPGDAYSGNVFTVRFTGGEIHFDLVSHGYYAGELTIQEIQGR